MTTKISIKENYSDISIMVESINTERLVDITKYITIKCRNMTFRRTIEVNHIIFKFRIIDKEFVKTLFDTLRKEYEK